MEQTTKKPQKSLIISWDEYKNPVTGPDDEYKTQLQPQMAFKANTKTVPVKILATNFLPPLEYKKKRNS